MSKISMELLRDINKNTIDYQDNYDGAEREPAVLPARFPNLLVNGAAGIAVGMATNIPPHQLGEVIDAVLAISENPDITIEELMEDYIYGPDFPTGGAILGRSGIRQAFQTGKGSITIRSKADIDEVNGKPRIIVSEIPFQVNKARLIEKIADLVRDKKLEGITDLRDESDRDGLRIVIELRRDANANVVLNNLYKQTAMQTTFGVNMLSLVNGEPKVLNLKQTLEYYLEHQREIIVRRTKYELEKAEARAHILEGLRIALDHLDAVIELIRKSQTADIARDGLMERFGLSEKQAQAILDMRLQRLTGLEREKIENEYKEVMDLVNELKAILADDDKVLEIIREELLEIKERFNDERRTEIIVGGTDFIEDEDLIPEETVVITLTHRGYIKRLPLTTYRSQNRGGRGIQGMGTNEDDFVEHLLSTSTHNTLLFFTNKGKVYRAKGYEIPEFSRTAKGLPLVNVLEIEQDEWVNAVIPVEEYDETAHLFFTTKNGISKRTSLNQFKNIRRGGLRAINLREEDELISVRLTDGNQEILIGTKNGLAIRFHETDVRTMGRTATGVKGITLRNGDEVVSMEILPEGSEILTVTSKGFGKRTPEEEYRIQNRGGKGILTCKLNDRNGFVSAVKPVYGDEDIMIITESGVLIRMGSETISQTGRNTQGVKLIRLGEEDTVATVALVEKEDIEEELEEEIDEAVEEKEEQLTEEIEDQVDEDPNNEPDNE